MCAECVCVYACVWVCIVCVVSVSVCTCCGMDSDAELFII